MSLDAAKSNASNGFRRIWRWHSRAGILIAPVLLIMVITGGIYLLEPQIERALYRDLLQLPQPYAGAVDHAALAQLVQDSYPVAGFRHYQPAQNPSDSAQFLLDTRDGRTLTVFAHPGEQRLLGDIDQKFRLTDIAMRIHGGLMAGVTGEVIVELVACWTILMAVSGLYLWWPRTSIAKIGLRGILLPRLRGGRALRDLHAIPGALLAIWILVIIATGLPWSVVWGGLLKQAGGLAGENLPREVFIARPQSRAGGGEPLDLNAVMAVVEAQLFAHQYRVDYPWGPQGSFTVFPIRRGGAAQDSAYFFIDQYSGDLLHEIRWPDMGAVGRATTIGVQLHEGRLFGSANQMLNLLALIVLVAMTVTGCLMWWKRRARAAQPRVAGVEVPAGLKTLLIGLGILLPLAGLSMLAIWLYDRWRVRKAQPELVTP
ncbi:PepSY domain-containing protein [Microbulbifer magnicolonia]|uniref:PepSY-associated TM helix domain-containing protein n=1 Tax=Microbulbifer magnicolonia TaxID=3109744 RepID=UPI002B4027D0|nr:PepSY domain-containing protein [Microbulbifer sp. GG15]